MGDNGNALETVDVNVFTEQALLISAVQELQVSTSQEETIENNNSISYETLITARTIDSYGGLVTDPVMVNFQKLTSDVGGYLSSTSVLTDSTGVAESTFIVNSADFESSGAVDIDFKVLTTAEISFLFIFWRLYGVI